jgi:hypothetical protein
MDRIDRLQAQIDALAQLVYPRIDSTDVDVSSCKH